MPSLLGRFTLRVGPVGGRVLPRNEKVVGSIPTGGSALTWGFVPAGCPVVVFGGQIRGLWAHCGHASTERGPRYQRHRRFGGLPANAW
jgi:hypothetical protein